MDDYFDLGDYSRKISTTSVQAQRWFDRGLMWCYSFNYEAAASCFRQMLTFDAHCAMAHWGIAYAVGPYYNKQWHQFDPVDLASTLLECHMQTHHALEKITNASPVEQALIRALAHRYQAAEVGSDLALWNDHYADAMRYVYSDFADDPDVSTLFVDAMMNRTPWALWDIHSGKPEQGADTLECMRVLESSIQKYQSSTGAEHAGLLHLYIHVLEMSPYPEKALPAADGLRHLVPDAAHLRHMSTHIDVQCGDYYNTVASNSAAIRADDKYLKHAGKLNFNALSRAHNCHFKLYGAMLLGQYQSAMAAANDLVETIPEALLRVDSPPMADWLEGYVAMKVHALIRFGQWQVIIDTPFPQDRDLYCTTTAMLHYAQTLAHAVLANIDEAQAALQQFTQAVEKVPYSRKIFNNHCRDTLAVAAEMAHGEVEYRKANFEQAFEHLRAAVSLADSLPYDEPWGWMQPARHALGALLLEQGRLDEAEHVYRTDLGLNDELVRACQHRDNVWSLHGLHECLRRQAKQTEASMIAPRLAVAVARADVPIKASCLCRLQHAESDDERGEVGAST